MKIWEINKEYKDATRGILKNVNIEDVREGDISPVYETWKPHICVPGTLEFAGLYSHIEKLSKRKLLVYVDNFDGKFIDDLFPQLNEKERVGLVESCDPVVLGLVASILKYSRPEWHFLPFSKGYFGHSNDGIKDAYFFVSDMYENALFSKGTLGDVKDYFEITKNDIDSNADIKKEIELQLLKEISKKVENGFRLGKRKIHVPF